MGVAREMRRETRWGSWWLCLRGRGSGIRGAAGGKKEGQSCRRGYLLIGLFEQWMGWAMLGVEARYLDEGMSVFSET